MGSIYRISPVPHVVWQIKLVTLKSANVEADTSDKTVLPAHIEHARRNMIDAAVVRIMKARKTMEHSALIAEATRQLSVRFTPVPADIKKRIENLIERDYLSRDEKDRRIYHYEA